MAGLKFTIETASRGFPWDSLIGLVPHLIWAAVALVVLRWIGIEAIRDALRRLSKIGVAGLNLEFAKDDLKAAGEARGKPAPQEDVERVARRIAVSRDLLFGARILWVDDNPGNNRLEARLLQGAGAAIVFALSTDAALDAVAHDGFDVVISDIARGEGSEAGLGMPGKLANRGVKIPVIFYVGQAQRPVPPDAFGITDRPDELVHLVLDALARRRG